MAIEATYFQQDQTMINNPLTRLNLMISSSQASLKDTNILTKK